MSNGKSKIGLGIAMSLALLIGLTGAGCLSSSDEAGGSTASSGPIDGTYSITALSCNGTPQTMPPTGMTGFILILQNLTGSIVKTYTSGCVETEGQVFAYPSSGNISMTFQSTTCSGSCTTECTASSTPGSAEAWTYSLSGSTLTLGRTATGSGEACPSGQAIVATATKQ